MSAQEGPLADLRYHWDGGAHGYRIGVTGEAWTAIPVASPAEKLTAATAQELREKIRRDHLARFGPGAAR